jgi:ABC-type xylose transport system permease subunit
MASGLDDFKRLLKEFRGLSVWAVGGSLVVPFAAALADLSPPWPKGIVPVTAVVELLALALVFQFYKTAGRRVIGRVLLASVVVFALTSVVYFGMVSYFTYQVPTTNDRFVKGYECTADARLIFKDRCPDLGLDELRTAEYEAERLWTRKSIAVTRTSLALLWLAAFVALSFALGSFLWYQMKSKGGKKPSPARTKAVESNEALP